MARVAAMMVVSVMLVVVVAAAYEPEPPDSFKPATPSLSPPPTDTDAPNEVTDCGPMCDVMCSACKDHKDKEDCLNKCKHLCKQPHSPVIFACTFACADTMSSKFASGT